jgi:tuberous sclerosis protein 2
VCIVALTACILEMADSMYKLLPEVLLNLSKISATVHIAIPVLEFLSTLIRSGLASDSCPV